MQPRVTIVIPCFGRPARTRRIINNVLAQDINNWEAFIIGDGCPQFENMINSLEVDYFKSVAEASGNILHCFNFKENRGGFGSSIVNYALKHAKGSYFLFAGNDDILLPNHFSHYLSEIEGTGLDLVYYSTYVCPYNQKRIPALVGGSIGHSELILRTDFVRDIVHTDSYGHDWELIQTVLNKGAKHKKATSEDYTYVVTHIPGSSCDNID